MYFSKEREDDGIGCSFKQARSGELVKKWDALSIKNWSGLSLIFNIPPF